MAKLSWTLVLCVCAVSVCYGAFFPRPQAGCSPFMSLSEISKCFICTLGPFNAKRVTLVVRNIVREPTFEESVQLHCTRARTLFHMMIEAADVSEAFLFSVSYDHAGHPGFFVNAFNDLYSQWDLDRTWWEVLDGDLKRTPVGVSSYYPRNGETVTFNFTQGYGH